MSTKSILATLIICMISNCIYSQIFVDKDASGLNDGSSWADAYVDLTNAIYNSNEGAQLWIAEGVYLPGNGNQIRDTFFTLPHDLELYGGFDGTETNFDERDPENNITTLSGDYNGDDIDDNFSDNKTENSLHVMFITDNITNNTIIDGISIKYGFSEDGSSSGNRRRGGGILCYGNPQINNCKFEQNYGYFGGGLYPRGATNQTTVITNCVFDGNQAGFGAGMYQTQDVMDIDNCVFSNNRSDSSGGGIYNSAFTGSMSNCEFSSNTSVDGRGAGIYHRSNHVGYSNCNFEDNIAGLSTGGAVHVQSFFDEVISDPIFTSCTFSNCQANWGGAVSFYNLRSNGVFIDCVFDNNNAFANGGAVHVGFSASVTLQNSTIESNTALNGGAFNSQNDTSAIYVVKSFIADNRANVGGAFNMSSDDTTGTLLPLLSIDKSVIQSNFSENQGGAINIYSTDLQIDNSLLAENVNSSDTGFGGCISLNSSSGRNTNAKIINSTFYSNIAISGMGGGIGHFTDETSVSNLELQNNIFAASLGRNYMVEAGNPTVQSLGGNLSDDESMIEFLTFTNDTNQENPEFVDPGSLDFHLKDTSPCINTGIDDGAALFDIEDNPRQGVVDKGAYEFQGVVSLQEILEQNQDLTTFPNPADQWLTFTLDNPWKGVMLAQIINSKGQIVFEKNFDKSSNSFSETIDLSLLEKGIYFLSVQVGSNHVNQVFLKGLR